MFIRVGNVLQRFNYQPTVQLSKWFQPIGGYASREIATAYIGNDAVTPLLDDVMPKVP